MLAAQPRNWQASLADNFDLRRHQFDARLQSVRDFGELNFEGRSTALGAALNGLKERYRDRPVAGILLFTDGNATDLPRGLPDLTGLPPIYPVVIGSAQAPADVALQQVTVSQSAFEDAPVTVQAEVSATGTGGRRLVARVTDETGKLVKEQTVDAPRNDQPTNTKLTLRPEQPGVSFYRLEVSEAGATNNEATLANNRRVLAVDHGRETYRILYVAGRPNWEFKFLNRAAQGDKQVQLVGLIRVAKREPKFEFRGRAGESSNPLFRGFGEQSAEAVERYDQPVLVRLNTRDELELRSGFPRTPEELYGYQAVIVDDLEAEFFAPDQAALLQKFVSERGGGFLMLGGAESFQQGGYNRTPIGEMLPVYLDRSPQPVAGTERPFALAREGWLQPWARLRENEDAEKIRLKAMPGFAVFNPIREPKPGASVIGTVTNASGQEVPALVTQRFGRGRTAALMIGDFWRWGMQGPEAREDMDKAWRQLLRWLVSDVPNRVDLAVEPVAGDPNGAVELQVRVRDAKFQPLDNAAVSVLVEPVLYEATPGSVTNSIRLNAEPALTEAGLYKLVYVPRVTGGFKATAVATNSVGADAGRAEAGWSTDLAAEEFRSLTPNVALLEKLAQGTGGEVVTTGQLDSLANRLPEKAAPIMEAWTRPAWHTPWLFGFALACMLSEWGLRRWKGMP
ncbi:MAG TPA: hypothetical protein PLX89_23110 [Verrucomicrobiota bacterium]|nr:hypothetical protein [Verrucomicrobiales bacterium]HRI15898.1 hypothetical protein [Verrucomicrobiota bacterium]